MSQLILNRIILITGSTDGIGKKTALDLAAGGAAVIVHGRNETSAKNAAGEISAKTGRKVDHIWADLSVFDQVREMARKINENYPEIFALINNAGVYMKERKMTVDGNESTFQINHLSHFLLTSLLLETVLKSPDARIINVSSQVHVRAEMDFDNLKAEKRFDSYGSYALSKLANVMFSIELARRLKDKAAVMSLHPGVIGTKLLRVGFGAQGGSLEEGAETSVFLAQLPDAYQYTGKYFMRKKTASHNPQADNPEMRKRLWEISEKLCGETFPA